MEYGVFFNPGVSWILVWIALSFIAIGFLLRGISLKSESSHKEKKAIFKSRISDKNPTPVAAFSALTIILFFSAFVLLIIGFAQGCRAERANPGVYQVVGARLVYHTAYVKDAKGDIMRDENKDYLWKPTEPSHFELKLEGTVGDSHPLSLRILRTVKVHYDRVAENYKYLPKDLPLTIKSVKGESLSQPRDWGPEISAPKFIVQYPDGWWKFTDVGPENN